MTVSLQSFCLLVVTGICLFGTAYGQSEITVYMPSQNEVNAQADCAKNTLNVRLVYDPLNGYSLFEGAGSDVVIRCLVERHGWEALGPPRYMRGTVRSPRWHNLPLPESLDDFERGMVARDRENFEVAVPLLERLATSGHAGAQYNLGMMYEEGAGVDQDMSTAVTWYLAAAEDGHINAQFRLGLHYEDAKNDEEAVRWYLAAAEQGYLPAQMIVGASYALGEGVPEDFVQTYMWYTIASEQVAPGSMEEMLVRIGLENARDQLTRAEIREAKRLAKQWRTEHSD